MTYTSSVKLAPDPALPYRDVLLEPAVMRGRLAAALGIDTLGGVRAPAIARVNYQVGRSLRAVYRIGIGSAERTVAARMFSGTKSEEAYRRAVPDARDVASIRGIAHDAEIGAVYWVFPNDRKIASLAEVLDPSTTVPGIEGTPVRKRLVAYAPEKSATLACENDAQVTIAYAKVAAAHQAARDYATYTSLRAGLDPLNPWLCLPSPLAYSGAQRTLWLEALPGRRMAESRGDDEVADLERLGAAVAAFHGLAVPGAPRFDRFAPEQLTKEASIMRSTRPDAADAIDQLLARLTATAAAADGHACLHGDLHPKNAIVRSDRVALIDVEDAAIGATAADIASLLAALLYRRETGELSVSECRARANAFLVGYRAHRDLPGRESLGWHTAAALFIERTARAVTRVRPLGLEHFPALLATSDRLLDRGLGVL